jgi:hypothetical protein
MEFIWRSQRAISYFYAARADHVAMKSQALRIRTFGLVAISVLFLISVLRLNQLSAAAADTADEACGHIAKTACARQPSGIQDRVELWRGLAMTSLYLGFCLRPRRRGCDKNDYAIDNLR